MSNLIVMTFNTQDEASKVRRTLRELEHAAATSWGGGSAGGGS